MGLIVVALIVIAFFWVWGHGPRKTIAQSIVKAEDAKDMSVRAAKATPAKAQAVKTVAVTKSAEAFVAGAAVTKVAKERGSMVAHVAAEKGSELVSETNHYFKGFAGDVALMRRQILADRKRNARADRVAAEQGFRNIAG